MHFNKTGKHHIEIQWMNENIKTRPQHNNIKCGHGQLLRQCTQCHNAVLYPWEKDNIQVRTILRTAA